MKFAVIKSGGKQYKVSEGDIVELERINSTDKKISFADVLLYADGDNLEIGTPNATGVMVGATILEDFRGEKIRVAKFKAKARYRKVNGHRQALTRVKIDSIAKGVASGKKEAKARPTATKAKA